MAKKTHPHKRSSVRKAAKRKPSAIASWIYRLRTKTALAVIASTLFATAALAYWKASDNEVGAPESVTSEAANKSRVKDVPTLSEKELADIPPEAFHPQPPMAAGYNAHSGGLPSGALPPGVVLPGVATMQGGRTTAQGYGMSDGVRQQFTSKERDNETGLDYFGARYYSSAQGRFTSPDEFSGGPQEVYALGSGDPVQQALPYADLTNPQSLNQYAYAFNNPLRYTDPSGHQQQSDANPVTKWLGSLIRTLLNQKDQYPAEPERRGPLSLDEDRVNAQATQRAGEQARVTADIVKNTGLDLGAIQYVEDVVNNKPGAAAISGVLFVVSAGTFGKGGNLREGAVVIGENMAERVEPAAQALTANVYKPLTKVTEESCARFVSRAVNGGKGVFDVGIEGRKSPFYAREFKRLQSMGLEQVERGQLKLKNQRITFYEWVKKPL